MTVGTTSECLHPNLITLGHIPAVVMQTTTGQLPVDSQHLYGGFNLGLHVHDNPVQVHRNRCILLAEIQQQYPHIQRIQWLNQVHGDSVYHVTDGVTDPNANFVKALATCADAHITTLADTALAIMTADCVPIMISDSDGEMIAAIHAGWQGLAKGIIAKTVQKMVHQITLDNQRIRLQALHPITQGWQAWVGACIAQVHYEVNSRVRNAILSQLTVDDLTAHALFSPNPNRAGHYFADLAKVAELQLNKLGISHVYQSGLDSYADGRFYSYRQQTQQGLAYTGRMATLIFKNC